MSPDQTTLVQATWQRVVPIADAAARSFYDRLFEPAANRNVSVASAVSTEATPCLENRRQMGGEGGAASVSSCLPLPGSPSVTSMRESRQVLAYCTGSGSRMSAVDAIALTEVE